MLVCLCMQQVHSLPPQSQYLSQIPQLVYWYSGSVPISVWSMCCVIVPFLDFASILLITVLWCYSWWIRWTIAAIFACSTILCFINRILPSFSGVLLIFFASLAFPRLIYYWLSLTIYHLFAHLVSFHPFLHELALVLLLMCYSVFLVYR